MADYRKPSLERPLPVRANQIPLTVRTSAAQRIADRVSPSERAALLHAALQPSDTVYFVPLEYEPMLRAWGVWAA